MNLPIRFIIIENDLNIYLLMYKITNAKIVLMDNDDINRACKYDVKDPFI